MNPAVKWVAPRGRGYEGKGGAGVPDSGVKDSIRGIGRPGRRTMIIACPRPKNGVANLGGNRAGIKVGPTLPDGNIPRRRGSEDRNEQSKKGK